MSGRSKGGEPFPSPSVYHCFCQSAVVFSQRPEQLHFHRSSFPFIGVPCGLNCVPSFSSLGVVLCPALVCCYQSPQIGCVFCYCQSCQFCQYSFLLSARVCIVCVPPRCFHLFEQRRFVIAASNRDLRRQFCNLRRQFFVFSGSIFRIGHTMQ